MLICCSGILCAMALALDVVKKLLKEKQEEEAAIDVEINALKAKLHAKENAKACVKAEVKGLLAAVKKAAQHQTGVDAVIKKEEVETVGPSQMKKEPSECSGSSSSSSSSSCSSQRKKRKTAGASGSVEVEVQSAGMVVVDAQQPVVSAIGRGGRRRGPKQKWGINCCPVCERWAVNQPQGHYKHDNSYPNCKLFERTD